MFVTNFSSLYKIRPQKIIWACTKLMGYNKKCIKINSCEPRTRNWGCHMHRLSQFGRLEKETLMGIFQSLVVLFQWVCINDSWAQISRSWLREVGPIVICFHPTFIQTWCVHLYWATAHTPVHHYATAYKTAPNHITHRKHKILANKLHTHSHQIMETITGVIHKLISQLLLSAAHTLYHVPLTYGPDVIVMPISFFSVAPLIHLSSEQNSLMC